MTPWAFLFFLFSAFAEDRAIIVNSKPSNAKIYLNGENTTQTTPSRFEKIKISDKFVLKKEEFEDCVVEAKIDKNIISCELKRTGKSK